METGRVGLSFLVPLAENGSKCNQKKEKIEFFENFYINFPFQLKIS